MGAILTRLATTVALQTKRTVAKITIRFGHVAADGTQNFNRVLNWLHGKGIIVQLRTDLLPGENQEDRHADGQQGQPEYSQLKILMHSGERL